MPSKPLIKPIRERIILYLQEHRTTSVPFLSQLWGLTRADIRYHLDALIDEGVVELSPVIPLTPTHRGRPQKYYRLSNHAFANNLASLSAALIDALVPQENDDNQHELLQQIVDHMTEEQHIDQNPILLMNRAVVYLTDHGYRASWEASTAGPRVFLRNCPYSAIIADHPVLCTLDQILLERIFQRPFDQTAKINLHTGKPAACIFQASMKIGIKKPES